MPPREVVDVPVLLSMRDIRKSFFGIPANDGISLEVEEGEIHALLGENGAGKTTLMNILYGLYARDSGGIFWRGEPFTASSPSDAILKGIGMVHQHFMLVPTLTVSQNITLGLKTPGYPFVDRKKLDGHIRGICATYGLELDPGARVSSLSVGEQQRVEIMKLLYRNAKLLILDEPTAVLTPLETEGFFKVLRRLREEGHSVILITHRIPEVLAITDRISVLRDGVKIATLDTRVAEAGELSRLMIGRAQEAVTRPARPERFLNDAPVLEIGPDGGTGGAVDGRVLKLSLGAGEILGIAGVDGNGQKALAECILGVRSGLHSIRLKGTDIGNLGIAARKRLGIAYISDDRHRDGLIPGMDLAENFLLGHGRTPGHAAGHAGVRGSGSRRGSGSGSAGSGRALVRGMFVDRQACVAATAEAVQSYRIKTAGIGRPVRLLSGGNQQKLILARELSGSPSLIVAFQPTRGLDIGASEFIRERLLERRAAGCAILLISADLEEILSLSDRVAVMYRGGVSESMRNDDSLDLTKLGLLMAGHSAGQPASPFAGPTNELSAGHSNGEGS